MSNLINENEKLINSNTFNSLLLVLIFVFQYLSKRNEIKKYSFNEDSLSNYNKNIIEQKKIADKLFWKYIIIFQLAKSADWCLGPFAHEFFSEYHRLSLEEIAKMNVISFTTNLILGPSLIGYLNDQINKKLPCSLYSISLALSCLIRLYKDNIICLIISQILFGMSNGLLYSSFENWFINEANVLIKHKEVKDYLFSSTFEKSMISDSISAVLISIISGRLKAMFGITSPYILSANLNLITFIIIQFLISNSSTDNVDNKIISNKNNNKFNPIDVLTNTTNCIKILYRQPFLIAIGITESLFMSLLHIFIFCWVPTIKEYNSEADTSNIFMSLMLSLMCGGAFFRVAYFYFDNNSFTVSKIVSFLNILAFNFILFGSNYNTIIIGYMLFEGGIGILYPVYSNIKSEYLPKENRGTLMSLFRVPFNIIVITLLITTNNVLTIRGFWILCLIISIICLIIQVLLFNSINNSNKDSINNNITINKKLKIN